MPNLIVRSLRCRRWFRYALIASLLVVMFSLAVDSMRKESVTIDEPVHLTAGYTYWVFNDYRLQTSQGALPQRWFALPLLAANVKFPSRDDDSWHQPGRLGFQICHHFFFDSGNDPDAMVFRGRLMAIVIALTMALAVYAWTAQVFGPISGLLACCLCTLDTTILAHGRLMTSDVTAALFFLMSVGCFWKLLRCFTYFRLASSTVCFGLLMVSKMSGGLVAPMFLLMFITRIVLWRPWPVWLSGFRRIRIYTLRGKACLACAVVLVHGLGALAIIWSFYGWQYSPSPDWNAARDSYMEPRDSVFDSIGILQVPFATLKKWKILPEAYLYGIAQVLKSSAEHPTFLNGQYSMEGWWYYFPYCFLVKTPLTLLAFIALGAGSLIYRIARRGSTRRAALLVWLDRTSIIWSIVLVYGLSAISTNINIGLRHLLPIYPPLFMLAGAAGWWFRQNTRWLRATIVILLMLHVVIIAGIHPHYIAYFNELVGGPSKGYLHLTDSNVDWGQDFPSLARWLNEHRDLTNDGVLYFNHFCFDSPQRWGIQSRYLPDISNPRLSSADPVTCRAGTYCLSATALILPGWGKPPWDDAHEREYRGLLRKFKEMEQTNLFFTNKEENAKMWRNFLEVLAERQYHRLRNYLLKREPDAMIGYSILVFRLSDKELHKALIP